MSTKIQDRQEVRRSVAVLDMGSHAHLREVREKTGTGNRKSAPQFSAVTKTKKNMFLCFYQKEHSCFGKFYSVCFSSETPRTGSFKFASFLLVFRAYSA